MSSEEILEAVRQDIMNTLPPNAEITSFILKVRKSRFTVKMKNLSATRAKDIKNLVKRMRKRIVIRSDPISDGIVTRRSILN